jgi:hypothetical protein
MEIPETLYYTSILYKDGRQITPSYLVFEKLPEGVTMLRQLFAEEQDQIESFIVKELKFLETKVLPEQASILIPHTDDTIVEEAQPDLQEHLVELAEEGDPSESIMAIMPEEQVAEDLLCRAFYMGPFKKAENAQHFANLLVLDPFLAAAPIDYVWLYRPTGEMKAIKP